VTVEKGLWNFSRIYYGINISPLFFCFILHKHPVLGIPIVLNFLEPINTRDLHEKIHKELIMSIVKRLKQDFIAWFVKIRPMMLPGMKYVELNYFAGRLPILRRLHPWVRSESNSSSYLPIKVTIDETVGQPHSEVLPPQILHDLIDTAKQHVIMDCCLCRNTHQCKNHSIEIGCLFMGPTALEIPQKIGRRVTREEAHAHVGRAIENGLVPMAGKVRVDNFLFLAPDRRQLLSVCFCCHCCCMMGYYRHAGKHINEMMVPLEGTRIVVTDRCKGCGTCVETCIFEAIKVNGGRAVHTSACRVCGRCVRYCPNNAVELWIDNPNYVEEVKKRILSYVDL
jgi:UDP-glucose 4-epimerase